MPVAALTSPIYNQQPEESDRAYEAFRKYRDMGAARNLRQVAQELDKSATQMGKWSSHWRWTERVRAYDAHLDYQMRLRTEEEHFNKLAAYRERAERAASVASESAILLMQKANERMAIMKPEEIEAGEVASMIRAAAQSLNLSLTAEAEAISVNGLERALKEKMDNEFPDTP